jgi:sarcosine oxidase subunit beta
MAAASSGVSQRDGTPSERWRTSDPAGLVYATGFSGHGFQQGPVVGEHLAELALELPPTFDLSALALERFGRGALKPERNVV